MHGHSPAETALCSIVSGKKNKTFPVGELTGGISVDRERRGLKSSLLRASPGTSGKYEAGTANAVVNKFTQQSLL